MERLLIDTDPGVDDAQAILLAAAHPQTTIEAIMTVGGNVGLEHTTRNALAIVELLGQDIPVYEGCDGPLVVAGEDAAAVHGSDGLGDCGIRPTSGQKEAEHAALAHVRLISESPNQLTLVAIGPLTNIAVALKLDPALPKKVKRFVVMGGAVSAHGNTDTVCAEFNIFADPEAAHVVFEAWALAERQIELVDWEVTSRHGVPEALLNEWGALDSANGRFFKSIIGTTLTYIKEKFGRSELFNADPLALAVAVEPSCVLDAVEKYVTVELNGRLTRGQTVVDWDDRLKKTANTRIITAVNLERYYEMLKAGLE